MELKFKNSCILNLFAAVFCSGATLFLLTFGIIGSSITGEPKYNILVLEIFCSILLAIWIIYFIVTFLFYKTIIVTEDNITLKRRKKILWTINREDILECVYEPLTFYNFYSPNAASMLFKMKSTNKFAELKISKNFSSPIYISLTYKNVKQMSDLGYNIRIIDSIHKQ